MRYGGLVVAAGLSSRMGQFKPLMQLNGFPMLEMTVRSMRNAGADPVCVVAGREAEAIEALAPGWGAIVVRNPDYAETDMLASIRVGIAELMRTQVDAVFLLPGDIPLVSPLTFAALRDAADGGPDIIIPTHEGKGGHPVLIGRACFPAILDGEYTGGLREVMEGFAVRKVEVEDDCINLDADHPEEFAVLVERARALRGLAADECEQLYDEVGLPDHIRDHCRAVARIATHMADALIAQGRCLDRELCRSGGALHDIRRLEKKHARAGAAFLEGKGYSALAAVVGGHQSFSGWAVEPTLDEAALVMLADKLVSGSERVSLDERYAKAMGKHPPGTEVGERVRSDLETCRRLLDEYERIAHERL